MDNFRKKFIEEAYEHINEIEQALLVLERDPENKELIEKVFRAMHSLKGGGAMFGFDRVSEFTHNLENVYDLVRSGQMYVSKELLDVTLQSVDHLKNLLNDDSVEDETVVNQHASLSNQIQKIIDEKVALSLNTEAKKDISAGGAVKEADTQCNTFYIHFLPNESIFDNGTNPLYLIDELHALGECIVLPHFDKVPSYENYKPTSCYIYWEIYLATKNNINAISDVFIFVEDECKIDIQKLSDTNLLKNKEFVDNIHTQYNKGKEADVMQLHQYSASAEVQDAKESGVLKTVEKNVVTTKSNTISSIRVSSEKLDNLMNLVSELVTTQARLSLFADQDNNPELIAIAENVQKLSRQLRDTAFSIVLIPIENLMTRFQRLVRDLSQDLSKEVQFIAEGTETELDKTIIENLTDPLLHILRNSLDHGIETPAIRVKNGKPRQGTILLKAFYSGANVHIQISDDGAGMDVEKIKQKAISKGIINADANLTNRELLDIIFMPGFSTATNVTEVSGRGVGMDVVRRKIADIRGEVELDSKPGHGTVTTIKLPLTLSIIDGLLVKIHDVYYVIPLTSVDKIYAADHKKVYNTFNNLIVLDGQQIPFFYLRNEFELDENTITGEQIIIVRYEDKSIGLVVDSVIGEYQAVLKPLGKYYKNQEIISGATILGDGTIALVIDTNKAIKFFSQKFAKMEDVK